MTTDGRGRTTSKLEGQPAREDDVWLSDLATVLMREHDDVLDRRKRVRELLPESDKSPPAPTAPAATGITPPPSIAPAATGTTPSPSGVPAAAETTPPSMAQYYARARACEPGLSALCLSGGGIRSAAFALGVMQGLAAIKLLHKFDYLSTVSGGGYIGSWLTSWVQRQEDGYITVLKELPSNQAPDRSSPIGHLWRYSNYLTPRTGIFSADLLTVVTLYFRNLLLNWLVIVPIVVGTIVLIKLAAMVAWVIPDDWIGWLTALSMVFIGWALLDSLLQRPGWEHKESNRFIFSLTETLPMAAGAFLASVAAITFFAGDIPSWRAIAATVSLAAALLFALAWLIAFYFANFSPNRGGRNDPKRSVETNVALATHERSTVMHVVGAAVAYVLSGAIAGLMLATVMWLLRNISPDVRSIVLVCFGLPLVVMSVFLADLIYSGLTSYAPWGDAEREWLARAGGRHTLVAVLWSCVFGLVIIGSITVFALIKLEYQLTVWFIGTSGGVAAAIIAFFGKASATAALVKDKLTWRDISIRIILAIATPIFVAATISLMSSAVDYFALATSVDYFDLHGEALAPHQMACAPDFWSSCGPKFHKLIIAAALLIGGGLFASFFVNINRFSLHGVYRNRLIRAFLGASRRDRDPNPFTDFDERDNIHLEELWPMTTREPKEKFCPPQLHVINMALNILNSKELAWQERKALPFTATARFIGSGNLPWIDPKGKQRIGCFRSSKQYAQGRKTAKGITLGTVMTLSGAAASPNMGYHSSPALSLLLTVFNVRLGGWFGNPGPAGFKSFTRVGPTLSAMPLFYEALGMTDDRRRFVYLSDGGHFENLGIYEMIRRRCRNIVVSDAGNDPECTFEDLGNAVRKASVDFGVKIDFDRLDIRGRAKPPVAGVYAAVADIVYPDEDAAPGKLLYIKPGFHGSEPASARSYGELHPEFPHEPTTDQWFAESQFEAYRCLGEYIVTNLVPKSQLGGCRDIETFIAAVSSNLTQMAVSKTADS